MTGLAVPSAAVRRTLFVAIACYFVLYGYSLVAGNVAAYLTAQVVFGAIAVGIGGALYGAGAADRVVLRTGATSLVGGGLAQFAWVATWFGVARSLRPAFNAASFALVLIGAGCYLYAVWAAD